jgi:hypothetical protein
VSTEPRVPPAEGYAGVRRALGHLPGVPEGLTALQSAIWDPSGAVEPRIKELARLRNARITDCGY